jgi:ATP-dependent protease ClpP protease subunit
MNEKSCIINDVIHRRILVSGEVDEQFGLDFLDSFFELEQRGRGKIDILFLSSPGGDWHITQGLLDIILSSKNKIVTYSAGTNCSSSSLLFLAGDERYMSPNSRLMFHHGTLDISDTYSEVLNYVEIAKEDMAWCVKFISDRSNKPPRYFEEILGKKDFYVTSHRALELSLVHGIRNIERGASRR